jgi:N-acetylmuramoyl-L-alanine amidase
MKFIFRVFPLYLLLFFTFWSFVSFQLPIENLRVRVSKAQTISYLLEAYGLSEYACNGSEFLKINKLNENLSLNTKLPENSEIQLPVKLYNFNGRNIRSSIGNNNLKLAQDVQAYNEALKTRGIRKKSYKDGFILVPFHLTNCPKRAEKPTNLVAKPESSVPKNFKGKFLNFSIFGKKYQSVPLLSGKLKGKIFYVEAGHGGPDPGALAKVNGRTLCEDEYAYDVSLRIARVLVSHSATVYIVNRDANDGIRDGTFLLCDSDERTFQTKKYL